MSNNGAIMQSSEAEVVDANDKIEGVSLGSLYRTLSGLFITVKKHKINIVSIHGHNENGNFVMRVIDDAARMWGIGTTARLINSKSIKCPACSEAKQGCCCACGCEIAADDQAITPNLYNLEVHDDGTLHLQCAKCFDEATRKES